jgi:glutathione S-transferase
MVMLRVLGRITSINVRKVLWALDELGLTYEREDWGLPLRDPKVPEFLRLNPNGQVPVLLDDDFVLSESNAILVYLAEREGGRLLPADIRTRALALQWLSWQGTELGTTWGYAFLALGRRVAGYDDADRIAASIARWTPKMQILEGQLERSGDFVCGAEFTVADIALGLSVHRWFSTDFDHPDLPAVSAYYQRLLSRPAGARYMTKELG